MAKPKRLRKLRINRVDLVDRGANPDADVLLFKRDVEKQPLTTAQRNALPDSAFALIKPGGKKDDEGKTEPRSLRLLPFKKPNGDIDLPRLRNALARLSQTDLTDAQQATARGKLRAAARQAQIGEFAKETPMHELLISLRKHPPSDDLRKAVDWLEQIYDSVASSIKKQEPDDDDEPEDRTFDDVMIRRSAHQVMQRVQEFAMALDETIARVVNNAKGGHMDQKVKDAVASFVRAVKADLPKFIDESMKGMAKADRLPDVVKLIAGELKMTDTKKVDTKKDDDKKPTADMSMLRKMFAGMAKAFGASDDDVAKLDPPSDDIWKGVTPALRARIEETDRGRAEEVKKREAAEKRVAKLERDATLVDVRKEVASYKHMGLDPEKDVELFEKMTAGLSEDQAKRMREIFQAADTSIEAGKLFAEMGGAGLGVVEGGDSADSEIEKRVSGLMAKAENTKLTRDEAMDTIMREDPALWERYRRENAIKV